MPPKPRYNRNKAKSTEIKSEDEPKTTSSRADNMVKGKYSTFPKLKPPKNPNCITAAERKAISDFFDKMDINSSQFEYIRTPFDPAGAATTGVFNTIELPQIVGTAGSTARRASEMALDRAYQKQDKQAAQIRELYSFLWEALSEESKHLVKTAWPQYEEVRAELDAARLIQRVKQVHERPRQSSVPEQELQRSLKELMNIKCSKDEPFSAFIERVRAVWANHLMIIKSKPFIALPADLATEEVPSIAATFPESVFVHAIAQAIPEDRMPSFTRPYKEDLSWGLKNHQLPETIDEALTLLSQIDEDEKTKKRPTSTRPAFATNGKKSKAQKEKEAAARNAELAEREKKWKNCPWCIMKDPSVENTDAANHYQDRCKLAQAALEKEKEAATRQAEANATAVVPVRRTAANMSDTQRPRYASSYSMEVNNGDGRPSHYIRLDNQAEEHIFCNEDLLEDIHTTEDAVVFTGIVGDTEGIYSDRVGTVKNTNGLIQVYYSPKASTNLLSWGKLRESEWRIKYHDDGDEDCFELISPDQTKRLYFESLVPDSYCLFCDLLSKKAAYSMQSDTVEKNKMTFTKREVARAEQARLLQQRAGFISSKDLESKLDLGEITDTDLTSADVRRADYIFGPDISIMKGKTVKRTSKTKFKETVSMRLPDGVQKDQIYCFDGIWLGGQQFLHGMINPLGLSIVTDMKGKYDADTVYNIINEQIKVVKAKGFEISRVYCDPESAYKAVAGWLCAEGYMIVDVSVPGQHVPLIERRNRVIKERARAIIASLPYRLHSKLIPSLVIAATRSANMSNSSTREDHRSPYDLFTGRRTSAKRDLKSAFGRYVQATVNYTDNSLMPRSEGCIALYADHNDQGGWTLLKLSTKTIVHRAHFKELPIPEETIEYLNNWAKDSPVPLDDEPVSTITGVPPEGEVESLEEEEDVQELITIPDGNDHDEVAEVDEATVEHTVDQQHAEVESENQDQEEAVEDDQFHMSLRPNRHVGSRDGRWQERNNAGTVFNISVKSALREMKEAAIASIEKELTSIFVKKKAVQGILMDDLTDEERDSVIHSTMFLKEKHFPNGEFEKLKARLCARGDMQDKTVYDNNSSPTVMLSSVILVLVVALHQNRKIKTADIGTAYLNASIHDESGGPPKRRIVMSFDKTMTSLIVKLLPEQKKFVSSNGTMLVELKSALYGCVESALRWYQTVSSFLLSKGYTRNPYDQCVFNRTKNGKQLTICLYVDDLLVTCEDESMIDEALQEIKDEYEELNVEHGPHVNYLGMTVDCSTEGEIKLGMSGYVDNLLKRYNVKKTAKTPATKDLFTVNEKAPLCDKVEKEEFHHRVAVLLYLAKRVRPDILLTVSFLASRVNSPNKEDWEKLQRLLEYINGSRNLYQRLTAVVSLGIDADVDVALGVHHDGRSRTGGTDRVAQNIIEAISAWQKVVSKSSAEAELVGPTDTMTGTLHKKYFLEAQGHKIGPIKLHQDNMSTIKMIERGRPMHNRTRHIKIRYFFLHDYVKRNEIELEYTPTKEMLADILTKPLQGALFVKLRDRLLNISCEEIIKSGNPMT